MRKYHTSPRTVFSNTEEKTPTSKKLEFLLVLCVKNLNIYCIFKLPQTCILNNEYFIYICTCLRSLTKLEKLIG